MEFLSTKLIQRQPLPVVTYNCYFAIHNGSVVEIVTLILIFGIVKSPEDGH
jgi:hypothetical protein